MNAMVQQASEAAISFFVKKAKAANKSKAESKLNHIDKELDDLSFICSVISIIDGMEYIPDYDWNIGPGSDQYGSGLANLSCIDTYFRNKIRNRRSIKNTKEVVGNYSHTQTKYSNECFTILDNLRHSEKKKTTQYTSLLYWTNILSIKVQILTRSGKEKYHTLKILLNYVTSATVISVGFIPKARSKSNTKNNWDTLVGVYKTQDKATILFQRTELSHSKMISYVIHVYNTNNSPGYDMIMGQEIMQELDLDIKLSDCNIRGEWPGPF